MAEAEAELNAENDPPVMITKLIIKTNIET